MADVERAEENGDYSEKARQEEEDRYQKRGKEAERENDDRENSLGRPRDENDQKPEKRDDDRRREDRNDRGRDDRDYDRGRGRRSERGSGVSLLIRNLSHRVSPQDLRDAFDRFGEIRDVYVPLDYYNREPKGYAFVEYYAPEDAEEALRGMDRRDMKGKEITVVIAKERRKTPHEMRSTRRGPPRSDRYDRSRSRSPHHSRSRRYSRSRSRSRRRDRYSRERSYSR